MVRLVVSFSGGKDSQATLIWACNKYGAENVEASFCDTGWEHPCTVQHVHEVCEQLGVRLHVIRNSKIRDFQTLCLRLRCFPLPMQRTCTVELKVHPIIDWVLSQDDNMLMFQGIRAGESAARAKMEAECMYFREYFEGDRKNLYRAKAVREWCKTHDASLFRPVFNWTAQQVIDYILDNHQQPNPLYRRGVARVGCFPCIMSRLGDIKVVARDAAMRQRLIDLEHAVNALPDKTKQSSFFISGTIPARFCKTWPDGRATAEEVMDYVCRDDAQLDMFESEEGYACMSLYHGLCE